MSFKKALAAFAILFCTSGYGQSSTSLRLDSLIAIAEKGVYRNPLESRQIAETILQEAGNETHKPYQAQALKIIGGAYYVRGDYDLALEKFLDSYQMYVEIQDTTRMSQLLSNIGLVYKNIDDYDNSLLHYRKALKLVPEQDISSRSRMINNIGVVFQRMQQYDTAEFFLRQSLTLKSELDDEKGMANTLTNLGIIAFEKGEFEQAIDYHQQSLILETKLKSDEGIAKSLNNIGSTYLALKHYKGAVEYARRALEISKRLGTKEQMKQAYETLTLCAENRNDFRSAFQFQSQLLQVRDSLMNEDIARQMGRLESKLELASKESEIERLSYENQISNLRAGKVRNQLILSLFGAGLALALMLALYFQRAKKAKAEKLAQESQYEALQKRFIEILNGPQAYELQDNLSELNEKLVNPLTEREYDALKLSLQGLTNKEIGDKLFVSDHTVKFHLRNIYNKLGVSNRKEALEYVVKSS
ncbi:MAG: tetratricopeptide repeat protein [Cyclobacteriaceae bacterium]